MTASIPQQVAAVASLPTQSGAHTFEEAPLAVWSKELMQEAMNKLSAADPCEELHTISHRPPALPYLTCSAMHIHFSSNDAHSQVAVHLPILRHPCLYRACDTELVLYAVLAPLIQEHGAPDRLLPTATDSAFHALTHVIMGQQLSVIAARNIAQKVKTACGVSLI